MLDDQTIRALLKKHEQSMGAGGSFAPATVFAKTDEGIVSVSSPGMLTGKTAMELRAAGFIIPNNIPDMAIIQHVPGHGLLYCWKVAE